MPTYNGHPSYNAWNVALWIANDEPLYRLALQLMKRSGPLELAARAFMACAPSHTPDGVPYTKTNVLRAMLGLRN